MTLHNLYQIRIIRSDEKYTHLAWTKLRNWFTVTLYPYKSMLAVVKLYTHSFYPCSSGPVMTLKQKVPSPHVTSSISSSETQLDVVQVAWLIQPVRNLSLSLPENLSSCFGGMSRRKMNCCPAFEWILAVRNLSVHLKNSSCGCHPQSTSIYSRA